MVESPPDPSRLSLRGGRLCLDFLNTVDPRTGVDDVDYLDGYENLLRWGEHAGALGEGEARTLRKLAGARPSQARRTVEEARELREAMYRVFAAVAEEREPSTGDLDLVSGWVASALGRARLVREPPVGSRAPRYVLDWTATSPALDRVLWPVARSAADLLAAPELSRVRVCAGTDCGWAFLDLSKNRSRRWCTMDVCGNREKARRHSARRRAAGARTARSSRRSP